MNKPVLYTPWDPNHRVGSGGPTLVLGKFTVRNELKPGRYHRRRFTPWSSFPNGATYLGLDYLLNAGFRGTTQSSAWYIGLISNSGTPTLSANDTSASHAGWTELTTYTSATRIAWSPGASASGSVTIASALTFTTNADSDIRGAFLANSSTKSSITDLIYGTAIESSARTILSGLTYQLYYTVTLVPS